MQGSRDAEIFDRAVEEDRVVISADSDFTVLLAAQEAERPSFILFREPDLRTGADYFSVLLPALSLLEAEFVTGCVAVFRNKRLRVRRLPFTG